MSCRRAFLLPGIGTVTALALSWYAPQYFSPVPELVIELKSCLEPRERDAVRDFALSDLSQEIILEVRVIGFNCSSAGTTLLSNADCECKFVSGCVTDDERLWTVVDRLVTDGYITVISQAPQLRALNRASFIMADGYYNPCMPAVKGMASIGKNGRIHLEMKATWPRPKNRKGALANPWIQPKSDVVDADIAVEMRSGQSCFIGGLKRKINLTETHRLPVVSNLPRVGSWFEIRGESEIDEELLILVTARVAAPE